MFLIIVSLDTNAATSMWHYVIRVNHVTVYRIIQLNYFNITKPGAIPFPPSIMQVSTEESKRGFKLFIMHILNHELTS